VEDYSVHWRLGEKEAATGYNQPMHAVTVNATPVQTFLFAVRVYYEDTDAAGVAYYASYLKYLERARTEWLRALGVEQGRLKDETGVVFVVRSLTAEYLKPARLDDALDVVSRIGSVGRAQLVFRQGVERAGDALFDSHVRVACVDTRSMKPAAFPREIRRKFEALL